MAHLRGQRWQNIKSMGCFRCLYVRGSLLERQRSKSHKISFWWVMRFTDLQNLSHKNWIPEFSYLVLYFYNWKNQTKALRIDELKYEIRNCLASFIDLIARKTKPELWRNPRIKLGQLRQHKKHVIESKISVERLVKEINWRLFVDLWLQDSEIQVDFFSSFKPFLMKKVSRSKFYLVLTDALIQDLYLLFFWESHMIRWNKRFTTSIPFSKWLHLMSWIEILFGSKRGVV